MPHSGHPDEPNLEAGTTAESEALFGDDVEQPPPTEDAPLDALDEFRAASISAPPFTAERPSHLGGPRERAMPAMPAVVHTVGERMIDPHAPDPRDPFAHLDLRMNPDPSPEDRAKTSRRVVEGVEHRDSPYLSATLLALVVGLLAMLVWMFGARVFG